MLALAEEKKKESKTDLNTKENNELDTLRKINIIEGVINKDYDEHRVEEKI